MAPFSCVLVPLGALLAGQSFGHMWRNLSDGLLCYVFGMESDIVDAKETQACGEASIFWYIAVLFTLMANIAMPMCTKYGSATLLWVVRALCLPLAGLLFASHLFMGDYATPGTAPTWIGLVLVTVGVFVFNAREPERRPMITPERVDLSLPPLRDNADSRLLPEPTLEAGTIDFAIDIASADELKQVHGKLAEKMQQAGISREQVAEEPVTVFVSNSGKTSSVSCPEDMENIELPGKMKFIFKLNAASGMATPGFAGVAGETVLP